MSGTIWGKDLSLISDRIIKKRKILCNYKKRASYFYPKSLFLLGLSLAY